jgi:hypothetical protein
LHYVIHFKEVAMSIASISQSLVQKSQEKPETAKTGHASEARWQLNGQILEASTKVSLTAGDNSQALLFRSAIEHINELLAPELGPDAIQNASVQDNSADATAERILSLSTGFYESYAKQHSGEDPEKLATDFVALIRGGFEKGFGEARQVLDSLKVFNGEVESGVMKTYGLVQKGYDDFLAGKLAAINPPKTEA